MTMSQLQDTRIGQLLQTIRHKVDAPLQKRIRFVIKSWQKLLSPDFVSHSVIPLKIHQPSASKVAGVVVTSPNANGTSLQQRLSPRNLSSPHIPAAIPTLTRTSNSHDAFLHSSPQSLKRPHPSDNLCNSFPRHSDSDATLYSSHTPTAVGNNKRFCPTSTKRIKLQPSPSPIHGAPSPEVRRPTPCITPPLVNGYQHAEKPRSPSKLVPITINKSNTSSIPFRQLCDKQQIDPIRDEKPLNATRLAKVKSTMELVQAAGDCIDSVTADRILTNRINKEADPPRPSIVPQLTRQRQSRVAVTAAKSATQSHALTRPTIAATRNIESEVVPKTPLNRNDIKRDYANNCSVSSDPISAPHITVNSITVKRPQMRDGHASALEDSRLTRVFSSSDTERLPLDTDSDNQKASHRSKKNKKHKHRHKHHNGGDAKHRSSSGVHSPPITNHLDDWPSLPPLPAHIDWNSLNRSTLEETDEERKETVQDDCEDVDRLLSGTWPGVNRTVDDAGDQRLLTELYSLSLDDQFLHILPWIDVVGHKREFFPQTSTQDMDHLIDLPDPW